MAGCGDGPAGPRGFEIAGTVELAGITTDNIGQLNGERTLTDATGVLIDLVQGDSVVASVESESGAFRFAGLSSGSYLVRTPINDFTWVDLPVVVQGASVQLAAPLRLESSPDLLTYPNGFTSGQGLNIYCTPATAGPVNIEAWTLGNRRVWHLSFPASWPPNSPFQVHWLPISDYHLPLFPGAYWIRARFDGREIANLVFLEM